MNTETINRLIEIRAYKLKSGEAEAFHRLVVEQAVPMMHDWETDIVAFGASSQEPDAYFLVRAYINHADLNAQQNAFYGSAEWRNGPREAILDKIESHLSTVLWLTDSAIESMRMLNSVNLALSVSDSATGSALASNPMSAI